MMDMEMPNLFLLALGLALFLLVFRRPRGQPRRPSSSDVGPNAAPVRDELDGLAVRLQEISREQMARLDTKMRILQQLLAEADRKIEALKAAGAVPAPPALTAAGAGRPDGPPPASNALHERIFAMADRGAPLSEIAASAGLPDGEVELILGLRAGRGGAGVPPG